MANQLEAPGAIGGQSAAHLALHLAHADLAAEVAARYRDLGLQGRAERGTER